MQFLSLFVVADDDHQDYLLDHFMKSHDLVLIEPAHEISKLLVVEVKFWKVKILKFHREKVAVQLQRMIKICYDQISSKTGSKKFKCLELGAWNLHEISWIIWNEEILRSLRFWIPTSVKIYIRNSAYQILETCLHDKNLEIFKI